MGPYFIVKRVMDFVLALVFIIMLFPLMVLVAVVIKLDSEGPVIFEQDRVGKAAKIFRILKFRSMRTEVEKDGRVLSDMEKMTMIGLILRKTSIDELPQLFNILRGEMSFIGPRPLLTKYLGLYSKEQMRRHEITPGISGWAQVNGRNSVSWEERFKLDVWYVDHVNLLLDLKILCLTIYKVFCRKDINSSIVDTMPDFQGGRGGVDL